ncbi:hypothetical protein [Streptomyces rubiginosohelvolus]|uniref:hypothetical protein n=1 Tax=Streptomyces rubiginosohelvolus TaxID=67362 RepID=UPI0035DF9D5D
MGAKNQALKNAARRRMERTGQSYEAALRDVRREYEQGQHSDEHQDHEERMGFGEAPFLEDWRPSARSTVYLTAVGVEEVVGSGDQVLELVERAEKHGVPGAADPITCHLCDKPVVVTEEETVHLGLTLLEDQSPDTGPAELCMPVWTHDSCGHSRVWAWSQLTLERRRRGLPVDTAHLPAKQHRRGRTQPVEDYYVFPVPENSPPLFYLQPGEAHRHGTIGFRADRLTDGLPAVDLSREDLRELAPWSIAADRTGLLHIERQGTGRWYQRPRPWTPTADWLAAAHYHQAAIVLTAPADSIPTAQLEAGSGDLRGLFSVGREGLLFGGIMAISGLT